MSVSETYAGNIQVIDGGDRYSFKASGTLNEGRMVTLHANVIDTITVSQAADNEETPLGYVAADWEANDYAVVYTGGIARLEDSGSGITINTKVGCAGSGKIKTFASGTTAAVVGVALDTISASEFGRVFVNICYQGL